VTGGENFTLSEFEEIVSIITNSADPDALVISGIVNKPGDHDEVSVTVIATGFNRAIKPSAAIPQVRKDTGPGWMITFRWTSGRVCGAEGQRLPDGPQ
jgi:cell division GTPase FtsZ